MTEEYYGYPWANCENCLLRNELKELVCSECALKNKKSFCLYWQNNEIDVMLYKISQEKGWHVFDKQDMMNELKLTGILDKEKWEHRCWNE